MHHLAIIKDFINKGSERSVKAKKNILSSVLLKIIGIFISLQVVPMTIDFVNPEMYGVWLTLSSIIVWMGYFDMGFANGFRNKFAETLAKEDIILGRKYVSTTYVVLFLLFSCLFLCIACINNFLDWSSILNVSQSLGDELNTTFLLLACFFSLTFVANTVNMFLTAFQLPAVSSLLSTIGQAFGLLAIAILSKKVEGSLVILAFALSGIPCLLLIVNSVIIYSTKRFRAYAPSFRYVDFGLTKKIIGLGTKFFVITVSMVIIFQLVNIILTRLKGAVAVTEYNIAYKYFNIVYMSVGILIAPVWSAFTDAYAKADIVWMKSTCKHLERLLCITIPGVIIMLALSDYFYDLWIGDKVEVRFTTSLSTAIYIMSMTAGMVYMHMINGIGKITLQLYVYVIFAVVSFPLLYFGCKYWGISGLLVVPSLVYITQAVLVRVQLHKIMNNTARGIWNS